MSQPWDVAVLGGGVIGLACAFELARRGKSGIVIERDQPGQHASRVAAGLLGTAALPLGEQDEIYPLKLDSLRRYPQFIADLESASGTDAGYRADGTLWVARDADEDQQLDQLHAERLERGLDARRLSADEVQALEPGLTSGLRSGLLVEDDAQIDPRRLLAALTRAAEALGVRIQSQSEAQGAKFDEASALWTVQLRANGAASAPPVVSARALLLTAGPWCDQLHNLADDAALAPSGVGPVKGQLLRLRGPNLIDRVIRTTNIDLAQRVDGELIVASTKEPEAGWNLAPTEAARELLLARACHLLPALRGLPIEEQSVGLRPAVNDHLPIIGPAGRPGLWIATGHYRHGILLAPSTAHWLAEAMESGETPSEISVYGLERRGSPPLSLEAAS